MTLSFAATQAVVAQEDDYEEPDPDDYYEGERGRMESDEEKGEGFRTAATEWEREVERSKGSRSSSPPRKKRRTTPLFQRQHPSSSDDGMEIIERPPPTHQAPQIGRAHV